MINWTLSKEDRALIEKIAKRAVTIEKRAGVKPDKVSTIMDITATHANGNPLRLIDLLEADDFNFSHDVFGIGRHIDRETGKLTGFFSPRYSARVEA